MPSEMSNQPGTSASDSGDRSSNKRRRTSDRSALNVPDPSDTNNARSSPTPRTLTRGSPQRGSSREMTPPESSGSIKYTRTGRVSKATKGQRVHHCEECGKTYTRAEHLRRHQQNHKPGAFPCDVPGCGRSFYREDLLTRHRARHDDPNNPPSRPQSRASQDSYPPDESHPGGLSRAKATHVLGPSVESDAVVADAGPAIAPTSSRGQRNPKGPMTGADPRNHNIALPIAANGGIYGGGTIWDPSPPYSPTRYDSPTNNDYSCPNPGLPYYHQPHASRPRQASHTSYLGYNVFPNASRTPDSGVSLAVGLPHWHDYQGNLHNSSDSEASYTAGMGNFFNNAMAEQVLLPGTLGSSQILTAAERDLMEKDELVVPQGSPRDSLVDLSINESTHTNEDRYLGAYWLWVHPLWPVVHRPTFNLHEASPLLRAGMLALGAHALGDSLDKTNARIVHERCIKVLKKRTLNDWHSYRLCDMQAIVLVEVYALFKSRRPPLQFSKAFEDVYQRLAEDQEALYPLGMDQSMQNATGYLDDFLDGTVRNEEILSKQRLLAACFILDSQHATLFGRRRNSCYTSPGMELPFPTSQVSWDGQRRSQQQLESHSRVCDAIDGGNLDVPAERRPYDIFQSMLMIACLTDSASESEGFYPTDPSKDLAPVVGAMQQLPQIKLAYNTFMLCKHTPIRDLLAVAGESWVMAEKLSNEADFVASQMEARNWASAAGYPADFYTPGLDEEQQPPVLRAVRHALRILELHMDHPKTGLLFQEWSVYLAAVVIWAYAYASPSTISGMTLQRPRLSIPDPAQPNLSSMELEQTVKTVVANGASGGVDREEARRVLLWTKTAIERVDLPHNCGLTNGALDVIGKLVMRGNEDGWFGA